MNGEICKVENAVELIFDAISEGHISLGDEVLTSEYAKSMGGSQVYLETGEKLELPDDYPEELDEKLGVFVTLNENNDLRGCIGYAASFFDELTLGGAMDIMILYFIHIN